MISKEQIEMVALQYIAADPSVFIVDIKILPSNKIVVTVDSDTAMDIEYCVKLSRHIEQTLDREVEDFELEVGSAGITSAIVLPRQWQKQRGKEIELLLRSGIKEKGLLQGADDNSILLAVQRRVKPEGAKRKVDITEELSISYTDIKEAKPVIKV